MDADNVVLVPGAGGVGRVIVDRLRALDVPVRVMVRRVDDRADELRAMGVEVVVGDLTRPETVATALEGDVYELTGPRTLDMVGVAEEFSRALGRSVRYVDVPPDRWLADVLPKAGLPRHTEQHIATMARLHRENRYDRATDDAWRLTGVPAQTVEAFVAARRDFYLLGPDGTSPSLRSE
ncbi:NAD(P)H-binding protein [Rhodococcus sp. AG1013]|uniref:NAD(P)H-binding protein n=1 Tax=unclassified Rhodococcus (in: high G+C Gram-positive bacteria) TaxID=192944 RepID=UPI000E0C46F8|nr:NAD(P)H-binding protein [Rhodococcus sp. AG1013]RDI32535.1 putative NAD(P)-binding protein [Rhodococcus sp. AG1013]